MFNRYRVDGIMTDRVSVGEPSIFRDIKHYFIPSDIISEPMIDEKVDLRMTIFVCFNIGLK